jgi:hypothetical protein
MTVEQIKRTLVELEPELSGKESAPSFKAAVVLLAALESGTDIASLGSLTGYESDFITQISFRMHDAELWVGNDVLCQHWFHDGRIQRMYFWMDVMVAEGQLVRRRVGAEFKYFSLRDAPAKLPN